MTHLSIERGTLLLNKNIKKISLFILFIIVIIYMITSNIKYDISMNCEIDEMKVKKITIIKSSLQKGARRKTSTDIEDINSFLEYLSKEKGKRMYLKELDYKITRSILVERTVLTEDSDRIDDTFEVILAGDGYNYVYYELDYSFRTVLMVSRNYNDKKTKTKEYIYKINNPIDYNLLNDYYNKLN